MKQKRCDKLLELIERYSISTQDQLLEKLSEAGYNVTQATVSRDIKELRIIKTLVDGEYRYCRDGRVNKSDSKDKLMNILSEAILGADYAGNIISVRCPVGMAMAACTAIDSLNPEGVVGTLAGDDTIFILMRDEKTLLKLTEFLNRYRGR